MHRFLAGEADVALVQDGESVYERLLALSESGEDVEAAAIVDASGKVVLTNRPLVAADLVGLLAKMFLWPAEHGVGGRAAA